MEQLAWLSVGYAFIIFFSSFGENYLMLIKHRFMIGGLSAALPIGRFYGIYDAKLLYITSIVLFMAGSALCGGAPEMAALIVGRVIAGAGGNGMYVGVLTLLSVNTTEKERPMYLGFM